MLQNFLKKIRKTKYANQANTNHSSNHQNIFKSAKNFLENHNTKECSSKTTLSKGLGNILNRKKTSKQQYNVCKAKLSLEVHDIKWGAKFLREKKSEAIIQPLPG